MPHPATEMFPHISQARKKKESTANTNIFYLQALTIATASNISCICKRKPILVQFKSRAFSFHHQRPLYFLCYQMLEREPAACVWNWQFHGQKTHVRPAFFYIRTYYGSNLVGVTGKIHTCRSHKPREKRYQGIPEPTEPILEVSSVQISSVQCSPSKRTHSV